ncbi:hypothetical protein AGR6A_pTi0193 [Agrobacterium sp. NCPPB 925]|uniref:Uncharacterized protein n=3 Tax=Agrobacterium tumefaciens complex TaxID=1183400 RepID=A0A2Z2PHW4_9HYPH|nr:hypothetical protein AgrTiChry5_139 [Agrobacterium tumefaciens]ASK40707.1 hypothetical protein [Agrobacterium genomosp. 6]ASK41470.1 hypothetical protein [Agrobacterium genomosp. 6]ASK41960.1 hypothetical protein [Agrobacterium fabrum]CUX71622.1 hypothetical protein AGR6A_pTi0193 [Agrobacterium sp. NCPPB 925]
MKLRIRDADHESYQCSVRYVRQVDIVLPPIYARRRKFLIAIVNTANEVRDGDASPIARQ